MLPNNVPPSLLRREAHDITADLFSRSDAPWRQWRRKLAARESNLPKRSLGGSSSMSEARVPCRVARVQPLVQARQLGGVAGIVEDVVPRRRGVECPTAVPGGDLGHQVHRLALHPPVRPPHLRRLAVKVRGLASRAGVVDPDGDAAMFERQPYALAVGAPAVPLAEEGQSVGRYGDIRSPEGQRSSRDNRESW